MKKDLPSPDPSTSIEDRPIRRAYEAPVLIEYGSVAKLTRGPSSNGRPDGMSGFAKI